MNLILTTLPILNVQVDRGIAISIEAPSVKADIAFEHPLNREASFTGGLRV